MKMLPRKSPRGLTLLELVVVLAILAIVTSIAVASLSAVEDQTRFDTSARLIDDVEIAILGERGLRNANNQPLINGFVADMGRLPQALDHDGLSGTPLQPSELWMPNSLEPFTLRTATVANIANAYDLTPITPGTQTLVTATITDVADSDVSLASGWRGPYLRLGVGKDSVLDSWGNPVGFLKLNGTAPAVNEFVFGVVSAGSDYPATGPADGFARDLGFNVGAPSDRYRGVITVQVKTNTSVPAVCLQYYSPDGATGKLNCFRLVSGPSSAGNTVNFTIPAEATLSSVPANVATIGTRAIRAYGNTTMATVIRSAPLQFTVSPGANTLSLELP